MSTMLSEHFSRAEFEHSDTASRLGLANVMDPAALSAARALCAQVLEPVRRHFGRPVTLNSGYRSPKVNQAVGSRPGSQHERGEAADHEVPGISNLELARWIAGSTIDFDQLILEAYRHGEPSSGWVHVSRKLAGRQRHQVLTMTMGSHGPVYSAGLVA